MKQNIGTINALLRITVGFATLAWITSKMVWRPYRDSYLFIAICAGMKIAEGIVRFCPVTALYQRYQEQEQEQSDDKQGINPS